MLPVEAIGQRLTNIDNNPHKCLKPFFANNIYLFKINNIKIKEKDINPKIPISDKISK